MTCDGDHQAENDRVHAEKVFAPSIYVVSCGGRFGTGWVIGKGEDCFLLCTARHVISASEDGEPIIITHYHSGISHAIYLDDETYGTAYSIRKFDCAFIMIKASTPGSPLMFECSYPTAKSRRINVPVYPLGTDVGWMGFPSTTHKLFGKPTLTLIEGRICAIDVLEGYAVYCVDGSVNPGMSGAPVWTEEGAIIGLITQFAGTKLDEKAPGSYDASYAYPGIGIVLPVHFFLSAVLASDGFSIIDGPKKLIHDLELGTRNGDAKRGRTGNGDADGKRGRS